MLVSIFAIAIPHSLAKYTGEKFLAYTFRLLQLFALIARPVLFIAKLYDALIRRLAGVPQAEAEEVRKKRKKSF